MHVNGMYVARMYLCYMDGVGLGMVNGTKRTIGSEIK